MKTSTSISNIAAALAEAQKTIGAASKDAKNPFYSSTYADLGSVIAVCKEPLLAQGISVLQIPGIGEKGEHVLETVFLHSSGEFIIGEMNVSPVPQPKKKKEGEEALEGAITPQALGSAITYARRYALQAMAFIPAVDDDAEWAEKALARRPEGNDRASIQKIIDNYLEEAKTADGERKKELLGLAAELRCKLAEPEGKPVEAPAEPEKAEKPAKTPRPKADKPAAAKPWREVVCHVGSAGGTVNRKALADILKTDASPKHHDSMLKYFHGQVGYLQAPDEDDADLWRAVLEWDAEWQAAQKPASAPETPAQPATAPTPEKPPQQPAASTDWQDFVLESKSANLNGKRLGDLDPEQMKTVQAYANAIDRSKMTLFQKKLVAMLTLASGTEPELPEHVRALDRKLAESNISHEDFLVECRKAGWIDSSRKTVAEITAAEAKPLFEDWAGLVAQFDKLP